MLTFLLLSAGLVVARPPIAIAHTARAVRQGEVVLLTIRGARPPIAVRAFDRDWPAFPGPEDTWRVLIGIDVATRPASYDVAISAADQRLNYPLSVRARAFSTRRLTVDPALVNPPPEARERIEREAREMTAIWRASAESPLWHGRFVTPVPDPPNSAFGTHSILNGEPRAQHMGADFLSPAGRPIKAPNAGRVVVAGSRYFSGNTVVIDHGQGLFSLLAHLSEIDVKVGDSVAAGTVVGLVGATGRVTGPHLHWTVRLNGANVDPLSLLFVLGNPRKGPAV